jgi:NADH-quinone oxidoreductase subunit N
VEIKQFISYLLPELMLVATAAMLLFYEISERKSEKLELVPLGMVGLACVFLTLIYQTAMADSSPFWGMVAVDSFGRFFKFLILFATAAVLLTSVGFESGRERFKGEYYLMLFSSTIGMFFLVSANDIIMVYLAIELVSLPSYVLAGYNRKSREASEAALKYVIYGAVASGVMLFGLSYIYGMGGTTNLVEIRNNFSQLAPSSPVLLVSFILVFAGFGYKIAAAPFHMWCPDVYQAAPTPITMFLSVAPKAAGFGALLRVTYLIFTEPSSSQSTGIAAAVVRGIDWPYLIMVISAITMTIGNLSALGQQNVKRLLAFSSVAHAGYILMGVAMVGELGVASVLFYLAVYMTMNIGAFLVAAVLESSAGLRTVDEYRGVAGRNAMLAICMAICLFSLAGIPPLAGFIGKFYLFAAVINKGIWWLAIIGILNSVISLYFYARIVRALLLDRDPSTEKIKVHPTYYAVLAMTIIPVLVLGIYWTPLIDWVWQSLKILGI